MRAVAAKAVAVPVVAATVLAAMGLAAMALAATALAATASRGAAGAGLSVTCQAAIVLTKLYESRWFICGLAGCMCVNLGIMPWRKHNTEYKLVNLLQLVCDVVCCWTLCCRTVA